MFDQVIGPLPEETFEPAESCYPKDILSKDHLALVLTGKPRIYLYCLSCLEINIENNRHTQPLIITRVIAIMIYTNLQILQVHMLKERLRRGLYLRHSRLVLRH